MNPVVIPGDHADATREALRVLRRGGLVAFPTDTVYGLGALVFDTGAVGRIFTVKGREATKAIPVLLADASGLSEVAVGIAHDVRRLIAAFWPGPLTLVVRKQARIPDAIGPQGTIGVRVPGHPVALSLLRAAGPLAVTSANPSGAADALTAEDVLTGLGGRVDLVLDGGRAPGGQPSTVIDCTVSPPRLLREGPISMAEVLALLGAGER